MFQWLRGARPEQPRPPRHHQHRQPRVPERRLKDGYYYWVFPKLGVNQLTQRNLQHESIAMRKALWPRKTKIGFFSRVTVLPVRARSPPCSGKCRRPRSWWGTPAARTGRPGTATGRRAGPPRLARRPAPSCCSLRRSCNSQ